VDNLLVMKFGGTSMGSAERMQVAAELISAQSSKRPVLVVVSAMSKITDLLLDTLRRAEVGDQSGVASNLEVLSERHVTACRALFAGAEMPEFERIAFAAVESLISEFRRIAHGVLMLGERPPRSVDEALSVGERLSSAILANFLLSRNIKAHAVNAAEVIVTDAVFGNASPQSEATRVRCLARLRPLLEAGVVPIVTGFNGATEDGRPTTLGRGGSDFSASILSAALDAEELWIWTDVDGIMTADPRLVSDAAVLDDVTYA
jgi:bifunctional aspartokinase / homoserine dehydrogenase 1